MRRPIHFLLAALLSGLGTAVAAQQESPPAPDPTTTVAEVSAAKDEAKTQPLTPQILYQLLLAEIAGQRGQLALSTQAYLDLARTTRDARIARRAAEIGLHSRHYDVAIEAAKLWLELEPSAQEANAMLANLFVATQRNDDLALALQRDLAAAGPGIDAALLRLNRVLARYTDKSAVMRLVEQVTVPYLNIPEAHFVRAQAAANAKDSMRALAEIDQALALRADWEMAALFKFQQLPAGAPALSFGAAFLEKHPDARDLRLSYARTLVAEKRYEEARREFRRLRDALPENADLAYAVGVLALQLNDPGEAVSQLTHVVELGQGRADSARFYLGQIAESANRTDDALRWYREVTDEEQRMPALLRAVQLLSKLDRHTEVREWLQTARRQYPADKIRLYLLEGQLLRDRGAHADVQALLEEGLKNHPDEPELLYEAGLAAERLGQVELLEKRFRRLSEIKPDSPQGYNALGYSLADRGIRLDEAERLIDKALSLAPDDFYILDSKGWVLFRQGKLDAALTYLRRAYALKAEPEIAAHIGEVLWTLGKHAEARAIWSEADKASPGNSELLATIKRFLP